MRINHDALRNFIKVTSSDLTMTAQMLRKAYIETCGEESCPVDLVFERALKNLRDKWAKENPGQPTPWRKYTKVDHKALRNFIKTTSSDLTMTARELREEYIKIHGEESCPVDSVFERALKNLRDTWAKGKSGSAEAVAGAYKG